MNYTKEKTIVREFGHFDEFADAVEFGQIPCPDMGQASETGRKDFTGTRDYAEAIHLLRNGWNDGANKMDAAKEAVIKTLSHKTIETEYDVSGSFVDVGRFLSGEPENMVDFKEQASHKMISIGLNVCVSSRVSQETIFSRGAAVLALIEAFEKSGASVQVNLFEVIDSNGSESGWLSVYKIPLKDFGTLVDTDRLAFCIAHPSFLRRLIFRINEQEPRKIREIFGHKTGGYGGYGTPNSYIPPDAGDIYIGSTKGDISREDCKQIVESALLSVEKGEQYVFQR